LFESLNHAFDESATASISDDQALTQGNLTVLAQLALGSVMILVTVVSHGLFSAAGVATLTNFFRSHGKPSTHLRAAIILGLFVLWMFLGTVSASIAWAILYTQLGAISSFEESIYFSLVTMATLGYGDVVLAQPWRLLSGIQGANGSFLFGWSTALTFYAVQRIFEER
jgi:voltage-gated potassium channel Kch